MRLKLMFVILPTWEAKVRRIMVQGWLGQKVSKTASQPIAEYGDIHACLSLQVHGRLRLGGL
jgi:hypothetical protein